MADGHSLVAELHQRGLMGAVEIVVPNSPAAEQMIEMMNKHMGAFLFYYLTTVALLPESFVQALLIKSVDPGLLHDIKLCKWNKDARVVLTVKDQKEDQKQKEFEEATWYQDAVSKYDNGGDKNKKQGDMSEYAAPEAMYNLDEDKSVKTIHGRNDNRRYAGTKGAPVINLGEKFNGEKEGVEINRDTEEDDDMSAISQLSHSEMVKRYKEMKIKLKGSAPNDQDSKLHDNDSVIDVDDSSSSSSGSSSSSSGSEDGSASSSSVDSLTPKHAASSG